MTRSGVLLSIFVLTLPITVRMGADTSRAGLEREGFEHLQPGTSLTVATGGGTYGLVTRGCENEVIDAWRAKYEDVAVRIEHRTRGTASYGVRGGIVEERVRPETTIGPGLPVGSSEARLTHRYVNPYLRVDGSRVGASAGAFFLDESFVRQDWDRLDPRFSASVRIGRADRVSLRAAWMEGLPAFSDGGQLTIGAQFAVGRDFEGFVGTGVGPDEGATAVLRATWWPVDVAAIHLSGRIGRTDPVPQHAVSAGVTLRTPPQAPSLARRGR